MKMKTLRICFAVVMAFTLAAGAVSAQDYSVDLSYMSMYVWRGAVFAEDGVFQPSLSAGMGDVSVNLWGNADLTDENGAAQMNEWDYTVDYSRSLGMFSCSAGIIGYTFPNSGGPGSTELYVGAGYDVIGSPSLTVYYDIEAVKDFYASLGAGYTVPVSDMIAVDVSGAIGFGGEDMNSALYGTAGAGLSDLLVTAAVPVSLTDIFGITPSVSLSSILNSDGSDNYDAADMDATNVFFGLTLSASF